MNIFTALVLAVVLAIAVPVGALGGGRSRCTEDMSCWSWPKMGNGLRGVHGVSGGQRRVVVNACKFKRMDQHGRINWSTTDHLRGDGWARKHGCRFHS